MPTPRIFVSSTWYDLRYVRENLKYFISSIGYDPILSEEGNIFYDPKQNIQDACLAEVSSCQMFVLIIGGRFGSKYKNTNKSITNKEFEGASKSKIPVFSLVERPVYENYRTWLLNKSNENIDENEIDYSGVDSPKIFSFIEEVQSASINNALIPFDNIDDIKSYLKQQWAGMLYQYITTESQINRVDDTLITLKQMNEKIEVIAKQILESSTPKEKVKLTEIKLKIMDLISSGVKSNFFLRTIRSEYNIVFTPKLFLENKTLKEVLTKEEIESGTHSDKNRLSFFDGDIILDFGKTDFKFGTERYSKIHNEILSILKENNISVDTFLSKK